MHKIHMDTQQQTVKTQVRTFYQTTVPITDYNKERNHRCKHTSETGAVVNFQEKLG